jgi:hypothetical protein
MSFFNLKMTTSILNLKAWEIDVEATQKKFDDNWKSISGKDEKVIISTFYEWVEKIKEPLRRIDSLQSRCSKNPPARNIEIRKLVKEIEATDEYKLAYKFTLYNWDPVCTDLGKMLKSLVVRVETLEEEVQSLRERVWMAEKSSN